MSDPYQIVSLQERFDLFQAADEMSIRQWPEFMLHDPVAKNNWMTFIDAYREYQLIILDRENIVAMINTIPLQYSGPVSDLPDEGWDWGVLKGIDDLKTRRKPDTLMGVQIVINSEYQGRGISALAVKQMRRLIDRYGLNRLIIPVRPNLKSEYPLIEMEEYILWKNPDGFIFDHWLRVHEKCGGRIIKVCHQAMRIEGTVEDWKSWTQKSFPGSGDFIIEGALNPVHIDLDNNHGTYIEPNVWVVYEK